MPSRTERAVRPRAAIIVFAASLAVAAPATAAEIAGPARVIDGDTIDIAGTRIRQWGIDRDAADLRGPGRADL